MMDSSAREDLRSTISEVGSNIYHTPFNRASHTLLRRKTPNKKQEWVNLLTRNEDTQNQAGTVRPELSLRSEVPHLIPAPTDSGYGESFYMTISTSLAEKGYREYLARRASTISIVSAVACTSPNIDSMDPGGLLLSTPYRAKYQLLIPKSSIGSTEDPGLSKAQCPSGRENTRKARKTRAGHDRTTSPTSPEDSTSQSTYSKEHAHSQWSEASNLSKFAGVTYGGTQHDNPAGVDEDSLECLALEKIETCRTTGVPARTDMRPCNIPDAIVTPIVHLARVMSIPNFDDENTCPSSPRENSTASNRSSSLCHRGATSSLLSNSQSIPSISQGSSSGPRSKVSRTFRSFLKASFSRSQFDFSEFDENTSEDEDRPKKSMFYMKKQKGRDASSLEKEGCSKTDRPRLKQSASYCSQRCNEQGCFHDCDVLHVKTATGHDCLVIECIIGNKTVIAGSLEGLVLYLCTELNLDTDPSFTDRFLRTCGGFASIEVIFKMLTEYFRANTNLRNKQRIVDVVMRWIQIQPEDLLDRRVISPALWKFVGAVQECDNTLLFEGLNSACYKFQGKIDAYYEQWYGKGEYRFNDILKAKIKEMEECGGQGMDSSVMEMDTEEIANYMAALDLILFRDASENRTVRVWFLKSSYNPNPDERGDPIAMDKIERLLRRADMLKDWVVFEMLSAPKSEVGLKYLEKFIALAKALQDCGNFHSSMAILNALTSNAILKLQNLWKGISIESMDSFEKLKTLKTSEGYKEAVSQAKSPVVPYFENFLYHIHKTHRETFYYLDASTRKRHMDVRLENAKFIHYPEGLNPPAQTYDPHEPPQVIDIAKHGAFYHQVDLYRRRAWNAHDFGRLSRKAWVFELYRPGRLAFCKKTVADKLKAREVAAESTAPERNQEKGISNGRNSGGNTYGEIYCDTPQKVPARLPPTPPITPPTSTYFASERSSTVQECGELDWMSEAIERRILEVYILNCTEKES